MANRIKVASDISDFFGEYLSSRGCTQATVNSYLSTFSLWIEFLQKEKGLKPESVDYKVINHQNVIEFINWLRSKRGNGDSTCIVRLAAFKSLSHYLLPKHPDQFEEYSRISDLKIKNLHKKDPIYLKQDAIALIKEQIDTSDKLGYRDFGIIAVLYMTGVRVSELINIRISDISLSPPPTLRVKGKGGRERTIAINENLKKFLLRYIKKMGGHDDRGFLFVNKKGNPLSRYDVSYIIKKYSDLARKENPALIPEGIGPHTFRHTFAMTLLNSGVDLNTIRLLLGHSSVQTTEIYARIDGTEKREAIKKVGTEFGSSSQRQEWKDNETMAWLMSLSKK